MGALDDLKSGQSTGFGSTSATGKVYLGQVARDVEYKFRRSGQTISRKAQVVDDTMSVADAKADIYNWDDAKLQGFISQLRGMGFDNANEVTAPALWATAVDGASTWYANSGGMRKITPNQYLGMYAKSQGLGGANLPSVQIYNYDDATLEGYVEQGFMKSLGRTATANEKAALLKAFRDRIKQGTVTTTKTVGGKKVTTQTPNFTEATAQALIEEEAKKANAGVDFEKKTQQDFMGWLSKNLGGQ